MLSRTQSSVTSSGPFFGTFALVGAILVAGCSSTTTTKAAQVDLDEDVAKSQASALSTAVTSAEANDGAGIAEALASLGNTAAALVPAGKNASRSQVRGSGSKTCTCASGASSCTFSSCAIGAATVSGSLSWESGALRCDGLTFDVGALGNVSARAAGTSASATIGATHIAVDCAITYSSGNVAGTIHTTGSTTVDGVDYTWDATITANAVTFTSSAFTGGSIDVAANVTSASESKGTQEYAANAVVSLP